MVYTAGKDFEEAVFAFVKVLDPSAKVLFDHKVRDRDTGSLRQVDVWVEAKIGGHIPYAILVSCKDYKRKVNVTQIGTFIDEVRSTSASFGVLYARQGFSRDALRKAKANGVACCRLYRDQPADLPILVINSYACLPSAQLRIENVEGDFGFRTWGELLGDTLNWDGSCRTVLDKVCELFKEVEQFSLEQRGRTFQFPVDGQVVVPLSPSRPERGSFDLVISLRWRRFVAKSEATIVNGSYCFSNDSFRGSQFGPSIDTQSSHPGPHWTETSSEAEGGLGVAALMILTQGDFTTAIRESLWEKPIPLPNSCKVEETGAPQTTSS